MPSRPDRLPFGVVHGRFQPFHLGHLAYCRTALELGEALVVGITSFDPAFTAPEPANPARGTVAANPFAYWERALMVRDALLDEGVAPDRLTVVALPIHLPERWPHYVPCRPETAIHVVRVFSPWEAEKVRRLRSEGIRVHEVTGVPKDVSASEVRARMTGGGDWESLVPKAVREWIARLDGLRRIRAGA